MYICGNCKEEMRLINKNEVVCEKCDNKYELNSSEINKSDNQDINIYMDYKGFKKFLKEVGKNS